MHRLTGRINRWQSLNDDIHKWIVTPADTEGYEKAEVTAGGVDTDELSGKTMESRRVKGLFFIGEVVDVTGSSGRPQFSMGLGVGCRGRTDLCDSRREICR